MAPDRDGLNVPASNREIAIHLKSIREVQSNIIVRLDNLEKTIEDRRFKAQDILLGSLIFPTAGGILLFLLTKALG